jgi:SAM-dependent methyltransferase
MHRTDHRFTVPNGQEAVMSINPDRLNALLGTVVNELGAAANAALVLIDDKLRLFQALGEAREGLTVEELAKRTSLHERYLREWISAQAASGFVTYEEATERFSLTPEQKAVFADEDSPVLMTGGFHTLAAVFANEPRLANAFEAGNGIGWGDHCTCLFCGTERFFRPGYKAHLVSEWLPALDGVVERLERGILVADVGCGHGASTAIMAEAFPNSEFIGFDFHEASIRVARAKADGTSNLLFEVARAQDYPGRDFGLVTIFDALHDMGDPVGAVSHIHRTLSRDGTLMVVEPMAGRGLSDNLHPVGRVYYAFSTNICVPTSLGQEVGAALGAQAGEERLGEVLRTGGFSTVRKVVTTPFNTVLEAHP